VAVHSTRNLFQRPASHLHEPFLRHAADPGDGASGGHALGGFLTMRLVDQYAWERARPPQEALDYQIKATRDYLGDLRPRTVETNHLLDIVATADKVRTIDGRRLFWAPLLAFAYWLEAELRLDESYDVLETAERLGTESEPHEELIAMHLQRARVLRVSGRFDDSREGYVRAGQLANAHGDTRSEFRSRIGRALILQSTGNLPEAERMLREVLDEARATNDQEAEAHALHDLGVTYDFMGRPSDGIPLVFRAFELYEQHTQRLRALSDLGLLFKDRGAPAAADEAFLLVLESDPPPQIRFNTVNELIETAAMRGDRMAFERWRKEVESAPPTSPYMRVDLELKLGTSYGRFGLVDRGRSHLEAAIELAERHDLNQLVFKAEAALHDLEKAATEAPQEPEPAPRWEAEPDVGAVAERLSALRLAHAAS
jgi:tetratricopeptide (TPR) repeat protein